MKNYWENGAAETLIETYVHTFLRIILFIVPVKQVAAYRSWVKIINSFFTFSYDKNYKT